MFLFNTFVFCFKDCMIDEKLSKGVETEEQKQCLMDLDCMHFQGYLFGMPMPIDKFEASLRKVIAG